MTTPTRSGEVSGGTNTAPNPEVVNEFHRYSDLDTSPEAQHHTLGREPTQASPGDHTHDGRDSALVASSIPGLASNVIAKAASVVVSTDANGIARITYPEPFPTAALSVVATYGDYTQAINAGLAVADITNSANDSRTGFSIRSGSSGIAIRINYFALGT